MYILKPSNLLDALWLQFVLRLLYIFTGLMDFQYVIELMLVSYKHDTAQPNAKFNCQDFQHLSHKTIHIIYRAN